jgi:hypothetical protein
MLSGLVFLENIYSKNRIYLNLLNSNKHINLYYHLIGTTIIYNKKVKLEIEKVDLILQHFNIDFLVVKINNNYIYEMNELINKFKISKVMYCFTDVSLELTNDSANYLRLHNNSKISYIYETLQVNSKVNVSNIINVKRLTPQNISKAPNISKELSNFSEICMSFLECLEDVENKQISKNSIYESVYIEFRQLKHSEFIIKNCIIKLNEKWSHTVICCNDNYDFTVNLCNKINKNINIIKLDITNATYNDYNNLLLTKNFWNNLKGTKILLYQSDSLIFNMNVDDFLHYDYIGNPFTRKCILAKSQVGNGGLSLRSKNVMLDVLNNPKCDKMYSRIAENFRLHFKFDNIPEDIYFSQNIQNLNLGLVADEEVGKKFGFLNKYENCFGMHAIWHLCRDWKDIITNHMKNTLVNKNCKDNIVSFENDKSSNSSVNEVKFNKEIVTKSLKNYNEKSLENNMSSQNNINLENTELDDFIQKYLNETYLNKLTHYCSLYNTNSNVILSNPKEEFRYFLYRYNYSYQNELPYIQNDRIFEAVLIEYRCLPHLEALIRNCIQKLGREWSHTIVCGNLNFEYIKEIVNRINRNIKIVKTNYDIVDQNIYNNMLFSIDFWKLFIGEKLLIYQEDTYIFKYNISNFIKYDYIGAPWPIDLHINLKSVGNGGLSLRSKNIMIKILENNCQPSISLTAINYQKMYGMEKCPEDVYFTTSMIQFKIGNLACWNDAKSFSIESINTNGNSFGGHSFWLTDKKWKNTLLKNMIDYSFIDCNNYYLLINTNNIDKLSLSINNEKIKVYEEILNKSSCINGIITIDNLNYELFFVNKKKFNFNIKFASILQSYQSNEIITLNQDLITKYNINFTAIYFPQFHKIPENDAFWGEGFTEWSLLKPYPKKIFGKNESSITILKPHTDIDYYELSESFINKQIEISDNYGIDTFMIYHYWFSNCHKVMFKPLEHLIKKPFCLCWANEPWSKRWDGQNNEVLLEQNYDNFDKMIEYLYQYFKCENYIRDKNGDIIYFIYNYHHLGDINFNKLKSTWSNYLQDKNIKIRYIFSSSFVYSDSKLFDNLDMYLFEPLENNINRFQNNTSYSNNNFNYHYVNYKNIINYYKKLDIKYLKNKIQGVCLNWNNSVRRKNLKFLYVDEFSTCNLKELLSTQIANIILKEKIYGDISNIPNMLMINAWNEWNEQAILEPNDDTGYSNLETIQKIKTQLQEPLVALKKENILFIDIQYESIDSGGVLYSLSILKNLINNYCVYFHPNTNKYNYFYKELEKMGINILLSKDIMNLIEWKNYNFKNIIVSRCLNHYYYDRLMQVFPRAKYYILTHDLVHLRDSNFTKDAEIKILNNYEKCFMISEYEIDYLINNKFSSDKLLYIPITLPNKNMEYNSYNTSNIFFLGSCHKPNIEALNIFYDYFLELLKLDTSIILHIYGTVCNKFNKSHKNIIKHGFVENIDNNLLQHRLCICPLISGAGVKTKIIDNLNLGIPIIATKKSIEGIELTDEDTYFNLDYDNNKYSYACNFLRIYNSFEQLNVVSKQSKIFFECNYSEKILNINL